MKRHSAVLATLLLSLGAPLVLAPSCTFTFISPEAVTSTETDTVTLPAGATVVVSNELGTTRVSVDESATQATVQVVRVAYSSSEEEAQDLLAEMEVTITEPTAQDNRLVVTARAVEGATSNSGSFNMVVSEDDVVISSILVRARVAKYRITVTLPPGHGVQVAQEVGLVRATGLDTASTLSGTAATIHADDCTADLTVDADAGNVEVTSHSGSLTVTISVGSAILDIAALAADDEVNVTVDAGSIDIELPVGVGADLDASASVGSVSFDETDFTTAVVATDTISHVAATLNGGGAGVDLQTDVGSILIGAR